MKHLFLVTTLASCAAVAAIAAGPAPIVPADIPPAPRPAGAHPVELSTARGVQIYRCAAGGATGGPAWTFVASQAELFDLQGRPAGTHTKVPYGAEYLLFAAAR